MRKACPKCGRVMGDNGCPAHPPRDPNATRNPNRNLAEHQRWARFIKRRDGYRCQGPGPHGGPLEAHHLYGIGHPAGVTLCHDCHAAVDPHVTT